ncbi:MAG: glycine cleavage system protein GcvH [Anaerolineae bacterium]|mgnify:CR=1 FL=1|nr:glycine cleavage system protein GcvH [Anaerolineae bacterium]
MADWKIPEDTKYTENDEWIRVEGDTARIGLTDYAQGQLSDIVFVDLSEVEVGSAVTKGEAFATVESVKAASDVYAPASGEVVAVNEALEDSPEVVNSDPYGAGWMIEIKLSNPADLKDLLDAAAYTKHCAGRDA